MISTPHTSIIPNLMYVSFLHDWRRFWRRYNFASHCCCQNQLLVTFDSKTLIESSKIKDTSMSGSSPQPSAWTPLWLEVLASLAIWCCKNFDGAENVATALKEPLRISFCNQAYFQLSTKATAQLCFSFGSHEMLLDILYHNQRDVSSTKKIINWSSWLMTMASAGKLREQGSSIHIIQKVTERLDDLVKLADHSDKGWIKYSKQRVINQGVTTKFWSFCDRSPCGGPTGPDLN